MERELEEKLGQIDDKLTSVNDNVKRVYSLGSRTITRMMLSPLTLLLILSASYGGCNANSRAEAIQKEIVELKARSNIRTENVIGGEAPEKFYVVNGQRVYLEIDGKPVESYFPR